MRAEGALKEYSRPTGDAIGAFHHGPCRPHGSVAVQVPRLGPGCSRAWDIVQLEVLRADGGKENSTLEDRRFFVPKQTVKIPGLMADSKRSSSSIPIAARVNAATGVWFRHRASAIAGAAVLHGGGGGRSGLPKLGGTYSRGKPWHDWGPAATYVAWARARE